MTYEFWVTAGFFIAAVMFLAVDAPAAPLSRHRMLKALQRLQQQQVQQYQAEQAVAAQRAAAIAAEGQRLFEIHQKVSKARFGKVHAGRDRELAQHRANSSVEVVSEMKSNDKIGSAR
ncbi:MAG: hypothetical protein E6Q76_15200 [Rhizobium sp.]|nr:MAG: hypothetical protein E6Q76_15200 [Rhizobium sp.]